MTKVVISTNSAWNIFNFREGLIRALIDAGHEVVAAAPPDGNERRLELIGCRFISLQMDNGGTSPLKDLELFVHYFLILRRERPDVFLGYTIKPNIYGSLASRTLGIPAVNNISGLGTAFISESWLTRFVKALYRFALRSSHTVFFQNADDRDLFVDQRLVRQQQTALLPGSGIDLAKFNHVNASRFVPDTPRFLLIARLLWDKGVGEFVDAARIVKEKIPGARFQLLGFVDVENRTAIPKSTIDEWVREGVVEYLGHTDDVRPFIAASDCVVLPSYREGTPRTLLEAAAMGKPLIASDVPGCREVVDHGCNGYLCMVRNASDLAEKMLDFVALSEDERSHMGRESRKKAERAFDERIVIQNYLDTLESILKVKTRA